MLGESIVPTSVGILVLRTKGCQLTGVHLLEIIPDFLGWRQKQGVRVHIENRIRVIQYNLLTGRNSRCAAQGLNSFFHMATSLPSGKVMGRTRKSKVLLDMSRHSDNFSLKAGIKFCSASIINCSGLLVKTSADFSIVRASCSLSPHTTTHIVTSFVDGVPGDFFESAKRSLLVDGWSYSLMEKLVVTLSSIMSAVRIRHSKNNLYTDFITSNIGSGCEMVTKNVVLPTLYQAAMIIGTDASKKMVEYTNRMHAIDKVLKFETLDIQTKDLPEKYIAEFEVIYSFSILHFCNDIR
ncbi:hypothetical protein ALC56_04930 [Trachymyrmex septentrionalis]|uniref:Uncharacterized protein n=1 Tax=Trachymyrmex septentrionalis TaxID=34720 RepID=A0A195FJT3_9HYME|nr:hypothetical protein ALC56_04930 [Trachymyrmex septentrionalis]